MRRIIYTQRVEVIKSYGERRDCSDQRIADFISRCGFLPIPLPNRPILAEEFINNIRPAGIVLTGGNSLGIYGGNAPERDAMDRALLRIAERNNIPLYGSCRGMQSILDYFGNKLVNVEGHVAVRHLIWAGIEEYEVNSYHNQGCMQLEENCGLKILAQSEDGVIEAVCHKCNPIVATMWHPEREGQYAERDVEMVKDLFRG